MFRFTDPDVGLLVDMLFRVELLGSPPLFASTNAFVATSWLETGSRQLIILYELTFKLAVGSVILYKGVVFW